MLLLNYDNSKADDTCSHVDQEFIQSHIQIRKFEILSKKTVKDLCEVIIKMSGRLIPVYCGKDYIVSGNLYSKGIILSQEAVNKIYSDNIFYHIVQIKQAVAFNYIPEKINGKEIYMITDPLCRFCNEAVSKIKPLADKFGTVVNFIVISYNGKRGKAKSIEAVCRNFGLSEYSLEQWKKNDDFNKYQCEKGKEKISRAESISEILGIDAVPAFFLNDGSFMSGADLNNLENLLSK